MERYKEIEQTITKTSRKEIWKKFIKGITEYEMISEGDKIAVCISGGKDSMLLAKCFQELKKHKKMNFDLDSFFLGSTTNKSKDNIRYYYSSNDFTCLLFICMKEFMNYKNSFRIIKCKNCNHYFIPKTAHKTLYCDNIFKDGLTCKEFADKVSSSRTYANDPICKKYRNKYKNLSKQASISNNPEVLALYERYKVDGAVMLDRYKHDEISGSDFEKWIDGMKIRK